MRNVYRFVFSDDVAVPDVEATLLLAHLAAESLHGEAQVCLDAGHFFDAKKRACVIDAGTRVGQDISRIFVGLLRREFGDAFRVERRTEPASPASVPSTV